MSYWDYYEEPCWEPSEADELFDEIKDKLINSAKSSIKSDIKSLKSRNEYLEERNKELEKKACEVAQKERDLQYRAENLRKEVENEFYNKAIDELFKGRIENVDVWFANSTPHKRQKCNNCDENRKLTHTFSNGKTVSTQCDCAKIDYWYEPSMATLKTLKYCVKPSEYLSERKYYINNYKAYKPSDYSYCDNYNYAEFNIFHVVDQFDDNTIKLHNEAEYTEKIGFKTKEECQKYCEWLNEKDKERSKKLEACN